MTDFELPISSWHGSGRPPGQRAFVRVLSMSLLKRHIFVCVNERESGSERGCCFTKGGKAVRDELKKQLAGRKLLGIVRANKSGCLDQCEEGVAMVVYPEQVWYRGVRVEDVKEIVESHILQGRVVERLLIPGQDHDADAASSQLPTLAAAELLDSSAVDPSKA